MHLPSNFKNPHDEAHKMEETLIVIGGGVAGLSAGCYTRMNGYSTTILEMAGTPGGLCTSWLRQAAADERFSQSRLLGKREGETR